MCLRLIFINYYKVFLNLWINVLMAKTMTEEYLVLFFFSPIPFFFLLYPFPPQIIIFPVYPFWPFSSPFTLLIIHFLFLHNIDIFPQLFSYNYIDSKFLLLRSCNGEVLNSNADSQ